MIELFDSHCHIDDVDFDEDREAVLAKMAEHGVTRYAVLGSDMRLSRKAADYAAQHENCWAAVGIHPGCADSYVEGDLEKLAVWAKENKVAAIGEIGLDYHYPDGPDRETQRRVCEAQMELAWELGMPVAYHIRDAHQEMIELLKAHRSHLTGGIIHCFSGSWENAKEYLKLGYYISFAGPLTFKKAPRLQEAAINVPADRLLVETDSPYMSPEPVRGRRNDPSNVRFVAAKMAELRGVSLEEMAEITTRNAMNVYRIK